MKPIGYMLRHAAAALAATTLLAGCPAAPTAAEPGKKPAASKQATTKTATTGEAVRALVTGVFSVPTPLLGSYAGGKVLVNNGGSIVAAGGLNAVGDTKASYGLLAVPASPLAGAKVYLADAGGSPIPGIDPVTTDEKGAFTIPEVPAGYSFVLVAEAATTGGETATYQTLVKSSELGATANVDAASTLVTAAVVKGLSGGDLGEVNPARFQTARQTAHANLQAADLPDFTDRAAVVAKIDALIAQVDELKASIDLLRQDIQDIKASLAEIEAKLAQRPAPPPGGQPGMQPPPPGGQQPPPGGQQPPPGGQQPPPGQCPPQPPPGMPPPPFPPPPGCPPWNTQGTQAGTQPPPAGTQPPPAFQPAPAQATR